MTEAETEAKAVEVLKDGAVGKLSEGQQVERKQEKENPFGRWMDMEVPLVDDDGKPYTKTHIKRAKKKLFMEITKASRRKLKREQQKRKRQEAGAVSDSKEDGDRPKKRFKRHIAVQPGALTVYLDCDWEDLMREKESIGVAHQLARCYHCNRSSGGIFKLRATGMVEGGVMHEQLKRNNVDKWEQVKFYKPRAVPMESAVVEDEVKESGVDTIGSEEEKAVKKEEQRERDLEKEEEMRREDSAHTAIRFWSLEEELRRERERRQSGIGGYDDTEKEPELVYLTSDAKEELTELSKNEIYIIGGLLDHNRLKKATLTRATEKGIRCASLPIGSYIQMASRRILTINHVFEIMLQYAENGGDWEKAFLTILPKRKCAQPLAAPSTSSSTQAEDSSLMPASKQEGDEKDT